MNNHVTDKSSDMQKSMAIVEEIGVENIVGNRSGIYNFDKQWRLLHDEELNQIIIKYLNQLKLTISRAAISTIADNIKTLVYDRNLKFEPNNEHSIGMANGDLHLDECGNWRLHQPQAEDRILVRLPHNWDPSANAPEFCEFLDAIFEGDGEAVEKANLILELLGYAMQTHCKFEIFAIFLGLGSNGKSILLKVFAHILGKENIAAVQPTQLGNSFHRATLHNKLANIVTESEQSDKLPAGQIKAMASGEPMNVERKFKPPFVMEPFATIFWATNHLPNAQDYSKALLRRVRIVEFNNSFEGEKRDTRLFEKLKEESPGIIQMAVNQYKQAIFRNEILLPNCVAETNKRWLSESDSVASWADQCLEGSLVETVQSSTAYEHYRNWCGENGHKGVVTHTMFGKRMDARGCKKQRDASGIKYANVMLKA
jgi:putative DNA primase/helicase